MIRKIFRAIELLVLTLAAIVGLFLVLLVAEQIRLANRVNHIEGWISTEIPTGSSVQHTTSVLLRHEVREESIHYHPEDRTLSAYYPHCTYWYEPLDANIAMYFTFGTDGLLEGSRVELSFTFF